MVMRLELAHNQYMSVISAYAPTLDADVYIKETFYAALDELLTDIPAADNLVLLGDFNARVGRHKHLRPPIGPNGMGKMNSNRLVLLTKCTEHSLVITNTLFCIKAWHKGTWRHPRSRHWHIIDYVPVITRKRDRQCVLNTPAITGSNSCFTDHRMVRSVFRLKLRKKS